MGLVENEESRRKWFGQKWWVTAGSIVAGECRHRRGEGEEEEEENQVYAWGEVSATLCQKYIFTILGFFRSLKALSIQINFLNIKRTFKFLKHTPKHAL